MLYLFELYLRFILNAFGGGMLGVLLAARWALRLLLWLLVRLNAQLKTWVLCLRERRSNRLEAASRPLDLGVLA